MNILKKAIFALLFAMTGVAVGSVEISETASILPNLVISEVTKNIPSANELDDVLKALQALSEEQPDFIGKTLVNNNINLPPMAAMPSVSDADLKRVLIALKVMPDKQRQKLFEETLGSSAVYLPTQSDERALNADEKSENSAFQKMKGSIQDVKSLLVDVKDIARDVAHLVTLPFSVIPREIRLVITAYLFLTYCPELVGTAMARALEKMLFLAPSLFLMCLRVGAGIAGGGMSATWFMGKKLVADAVPQTIMNTQAAINPLSYIFSALDYIRPVQYTELSNIGVLQYMNSVPESMISYINTTPIGALGYDVPVTFGYYSWPASVNYAFAYLARCMGY